MPPLVIVMGVTILFQLPLLFICLKNSTHKLKKLILKLRT